MKNKKKKSHKVLCCILLILLILIIAFVALYIWQRNNINAVLDAAKYSEDDIQQQIVDSKDEVQSELEEHDIVGLRDFTFEEEEQIRKGQLSVDDAIARIMEESDVAESKTASDGNSSNHGDNVSDKTADNKEPVNTAPSVSNTDKPAVDTAGREKAILTEYTQRLYALKASYLGQLGNLIDQAKAAKKNGASNKALMSQYLGQAASLEGQADSQVNALLSELTQKLNSIGADTSIVNTMRSAYENEKSLKKSYYLSLYNNKK